MYLLAKIVPPNLKNPFFKSGVPVKLEGVLSSK